MESQCYTLAQNQIKTTDIQQELLSSLLEDLINPSHELPLLTKIIDYPYFENEFKDFLFGKADLSDYTDTGDI